MRIFGIFRSPARLICVITLLFLSSPSLNAEDGDETSGLIESTKRLTTATTDRQRDSRIESRVREITWRLLVGELASDKSHGLPSEAYDLLTRGLAELDQLLLELDQASDLEHQISSQPQLAMRLDAAIARRADVIAKRDVSRSEELARLSQLRDLNRAYREIISQLLAGETELMLGRLDMVTRSTEEAAKLLSSAEEIVGKRRDFYLFQDEPALDGASSELKLVRELSQPYSGDVRRHHRSLLAVALCRQGQRFRPANKEMLEAGLAYANAVISDGAEQSAIALYARGLASLELGRLFTQARPFDQTAHDAAAELFATSDESFVEARKSLPEIAMSAEFRVELDRLIAESSGPEAFLARSHDFVSRTDWRAAVGELERGATRHRSRSLVSAWIEAKWRSRALAPAQLDKLVAESIADHIWESSDVDLQFLRGRMGVIEAWRAIVAADNANPVDLQQSGLSQRVTEAIADLRAVATDADPGRRWTGAAFLALAEATALLLDGSRSTADATQALARIPFVAKELEQLIGGRAAHEQMKFLEAIYLARIAEGYLALRLSPDYQDRARSAFAAATDAAAKLPSGAALLQPLGGAMLRALLQRDGENSNRLAAEERQLRTSLQRMLPAVVAMQFGPAEPVADSLVAMLRDSRLEKPAWDPRKQLDERDTLSARDGVLADSRAIAAIALISSKRPAAALAELLSVWWPNLKATELTGIDLSDVGRKAADLTDPLILYTLGLALEEYALEATTDASISKALFVQALAAYDRGISILAENSTWRDRWPYLLKMTQDGHDRLVNEETALQVAKQLRSELRLSETRAVLERARQRHRHSHAVHQALVETLVDEAQMSIDKRQELLQRALELLEAAYQADTRLPIGMLMTLGDLRERLGRDAEAALLFREIADRATDSSVRIKARSRLAVLNIRRGD